MKQKSALPRAIFPPHPISFNMGFERKGFCSADIILAIKCHALLLSENVLLYIDRACPAVYA